MYGVAETMALRVYVAQDGELLEVWKSVGNHGDRWILGEVTVHSAGNLQVGTGSLTAMRFQKALSVYGWK